MMIGHSGSGKTTYMAVMYALMYKGIKGFSIEADRKDFHDRLMALSTNIKKGQYPGGTDIHSEYSFHLKHNGDRIMPFVWYDYRGGALTQDSNDSMDVKDLVNRIADANALIVFFDGEKLMQNDYAVMKEYRRTQHCIQQAASKLSAPSILPVSLVFTKGDLLAASIEESPMFEYVQMMISAIVENENMGGLLTTTTITGKSSFWSKKLIIENIEYPFLISMIFGLVSERNIALDEHKYHSDRAQDLARQANVINDIYTWFSGERSIRQSSRDEAEVAMEKYKQYEQYVNSSESLRKILEKAAKSQRIFLI